MRLASVRVRSPKTSSERLDGRLAVVGPDGRRAALCPAFPTLLSALESWDEALPALRKVEAELRAGKAHSLDLAEESLLAPLPRTCALLDASAYLDHVLRARKARGAEPPPDLKEVPLMYQGASDHLMGHRDDIPWADASLGLDFEAEVAAILGEVPMGTAAAGAEGHIKLLTLMNDVTLRNLLPREAATGLGFIQSKPPSAFAPFAVTPDELGEEWRGGRLRLDMAVRLNGERFGGQDAGGMHFSFHQLIAHAARTRALAAGTILGSGTVSGPDEAKGFSCIAERRMAEQAAGGAPRAPYLKPGDRVEIEMMRKGVSVFGKIDQRVQAPGA